MATISYDAQSFLIDGRRIWLVSGAMDYARVPRDLWRRRLWALRQAGLNCVQTSVFWNLHEPRPGALDFQDQLDVRAFLQQAAGLGLYSILRVGPYVGGGADLGGLPAWLLAQPGMALRQAHAGFMEAYARFLAALMDQVRDLQLTGAPAAASVAATSGLSSTASAGTIVLVQVEHQWHCHHPGQAQHYLAELIRYLREHGCQTPILTTNNLWQRVEAAVDAWTGSAHLTADLRQLAVVQPDSPRMVCPFAVGQPTLWGIDPPPQNEQKEADRLFYRLACTLASGAQYNLEPFHGGTNFGFLAGRTVGPPLGFLATSHDSGSPLSESGQPRPSYLAAKRISTFASQFAHVLAHLEPHRCHAIPNLDQAPHPLTIVHQRGSQGHVIFVFPDLQDRRRELSLLLPDGRTLPIYLDREPAFWLLWHANLAGVAELTYSNLRPWAFLGRRTLVLFGPAGTPGLLAINGAPLKVKAPQGRDPVILQHEALNIVVLNCQQIDMAWILPGEQLLIGAAPLDPDREPLALPGWSQAHRIQPNGTRILCRPTSRSPEAAKAPAVRTPPRIPAAPRLGRWQHCVPRSFLTGTDPAFQTIPGPTSLESLGCNFGYGWYRLKLARTVRGQFLLAPAGDRLHVFANGRPLALLGEGPGAQVQPLTGRLVGTLVILVDNPGRFADGWRMREPHGLAGHIHLVRPVKLSRPRISQSILPDPFVLSQFWPGLRAGEHRRGMILSFAVRSPAGRPLVLQIDQAPATLLILVNNKPVGLYDPIMSAGFLQLLISSEQLRSPVNSLTLAILESPPLPKPPPLQRHLKLYQSLSCPSATGQWAFAPWQILAPATESTASPTISNPPTWHDRPRSGLPCWHRTTFPAVSTEIPLFLELRGLTKGQIFLNGQNLGRYFLTTASGRRVGPQSRFYLPEPWLRTGQPNELLIFDEHGKRPHRCRLVYEKSHWT